MAWVQTLMSASSSHSSYDNIVMQKYMFFKETFWYFYKYFKMKKTPVFS